VTSERPLWTPGQARAEAARLTAFIRGAGARHGIRFNDYAGLHRWSVEAPQDFWREVWDFCKVIGSPGEVMLEDGDKMPGARFFPNARLNFARNLLRSRGETDALLFWGEDKVRRRLSHAELYREVARLSAAFRAAGVAAGDRVAAYLPNMPEAIITMIAAASLGAVFSSCSPDFGVQGLVDRFGQIRPKVLVASDGYFYSGKTIGSLGKLAQIVARLDSVEQVVVVPYIQESPDVTRVHRARLLADFVAPYVGEEEIVFDDLPFDHPLYVLYSSGTTGAPKCILHGAGGTLLQHLKEHQLHGDVRAGDRLFYFTTCGWMMWNWLASGLASGATLLLYDGSPFLGQGRLLFDYADAEGMTHFGTSAKFIDATAKTGLRPVETHRLSELRAVFSTGSPLAPESFDYVYRHIKEDIHLASISGGTDIISCFVLGCPVLPVWRGEIQCRGLGMAVEVFDDAGSPVRGEKGELVCTCPFPSMPLGFWDDDGGAKYRAAYFEKYPNVWAHGDYAEITPRDGVIIYGRSDAVLNPGGVRIGTAEIYRQVERLPEVLESLVIGQDWAGDVRVVLFVRLAEGVALDDGLTARIKQTIRENTTPRHVPAKVVAVADIPRTKSGKIVELAVRDVVHGREVKNREALANPEALRLFENLPELRS